MAKKKIKTKAVVKTENTDNFIFKHPVITTVIISFILLMILYAPYVIKGKDVQSPDRLTALAQQPFFEKAAEEGTFPLWTSFVFSGMPSYGSLLGIPGHINIIDYPIRSTLKSFNNFLPNHNFTFILLNYMFFALLMYAMMRKSNLSALPSMFAALSIIFMPQFVAFTAHSHNTKFFSLVLIPLIFLFARKLIKEKNLLYFSLTALTIGFQLFRAHVQVVYYTFLLIGIYFIVETIASWREHKQIKPVFKSAAVLTGAVAAGIVLSAVIYVSVFDYQQYSIRGGGAGGGLDFSYASGWSFHPLEMVTFIIPSFMGFGGETYWGKMPFTDYPLYFGIVIFLLAGLPFILKRDRFTWTFGSVAIVSLLVSFGRHFPVLYTPMYKWLPYFNKFRIPSMIHILLDFAMVALAAYGLHAVFTFREKLVENKALEKTVTTVKRYFFAFSTVVGVIVLFMLIGKPMYTELVTSSRSHINSALRETAYNAALLDGLKAMLFLSLSAWVVWQFIKGKLSRLLTTLILITIVIADFWLVDSKIIKPGTPAAETQYFAENSAIQYLKKDTGNFRIFPVLDDKGANSNWYMRFFIQSITGYSAAKLRIYQEFLEETGFTSKDRFGLNPFIAKYWRYAVQQDKPTWVPVPVQQIDAKLLSFHNAMLDMLNVKYLVQSYLPINDPRFEQVQPQQPWVYENKSVLPRAWFVNQLEVISGRANIFSRMKDGTFQPGQTAILEEQPEFVITAGDSNLVQVTNYSNQNIQLEAHVKGPSLLVLSEVYYPAGWKAFVDGKETKIFKTNYILRSIFLGPGKHKIEFVFNPKSFKTGLWISLVVLFTLVVLLIFGLYQQYKDHPKLAFFKKSR